MKPGLVKWLFRTKTKHSSTTKQTCESPAGTVRSTSWVTLWGAEHCLAPLSSPQAHPEPCHEQLTALHAESSEKDRLLFIFYFLDTKFLWPRKHFCHIPGPTFCPYWHFSGHRSCTPFCSNTSPGHLQILVFCTVCQVHRGLMNRQIKIITLPLTPCWLVMVRGKVCVEWTTCVPSALPDCWGCW